MNELKRIYSTVQTGLRNEEKEIKKFTKLRVLREGKSPEEIKYPPNGNGSSFPYIYYFPYPKGPPVASALAIPKKIDEICPQCGEKNEKRRKNCSKCGASLIPFS